MADAEARADIAILAKAPRPGYAKTRLIPALGSVGAARLQRQLTLHTLATACAAGIGRVTLWAAPDAGARFFRALHQRMDPTQLTIRDQAHGDLGARLQAIAADHFDATKAAPLLLIGTDCPLLTRTHLRECASALQGAQAAPATFIPAEDGGYVLAGLKCPLPTLFAGIDWGSDRVMRQTRQRLAEAGLGAREWPPLWDIDEPADLARWRDLRQSMP